MQAEDDRYYAVIFTAELAADRSGHSDMAQRLSELVEVQPGYIGKYQCTQGNREITISYWESPGAVKAWKAHPEHQTAQELGRSKWYLDYQVQSVPIDRYDQSGTADRQGEPLGQSP